MVTFNSCITGYKYSDYHMFINTNYANINIDGCPSGCTNYKFNFNKNSLMTICLCFPVLICVVVHMLYCSIYRLIFQMVHGL